MKKAPAGYDCLPSSSPRGHVCTQKSTSLWTSWNERSRHTHQSAHGCSLQASVWGKRKGFCSKSALFLKCLFRNEWAWNTKGTHRPCHRYACHGPTLSFPTFFRDTHAGWNCQSNFEFLDAVSPWPCSALQLLHPVGTTGKTELERI